MKIAVLKAAKSAAEACRLIVDEVAPEFHTMRPDDQLDLDGTVYSLNAVMTRIVQKFEIGDAADPFQALVAKGILNRKLPFSHKTGKVCGAPYYTVRGKLSAASTEALPKF